MTTKDSIKRDTSNCIGKKVQLIFTDDPYTLLKSGDTGTITHLDDAGTIFVNWDSGESLGLIPGVDKFKIIWDENLATTFWGEHIVND